MYLFLDWSRPVVYRAGVASESGAYACVSVDPVRRWWRATRHHRAVRPAAWRNLDRSGYHPFGLCGWWYYPRTALHLSIGPVVFSVVWRGYGLEPLTRWRFPARSR